MLGAERQGCPYNEEIPSLAEDAERHDDWTRCGYRDGVEV